MDILNRSIEVILMHQDKRGAYIASPAFPTYHYCWLRDSSFIAHAMDKVGKFESADKFFRWVGNTINRYSSKIDVLEDQLKSGKEPDHKAILNARFTLDGMEEGSGNGWGNFQIDGYGTWLWALAEHVRLSGDIPLLNDLYKPVQTTLRYLELVWKLPNYDCWEENPEYLHPYSLASVFAGFDSIASLVYANHMPASPIVVDDLAKQVKDYLLKFGVYDGCLIKHILPARAGESPKPILKSGVDSSLIGVTIPYNVLSPETPLMRATIQAIETDLHRVGGGVYRYKKDKYYGGGEWVLLAAWLGWYYNQIKEKDRAQEILEWIETTADAEGNLPEQVSDYALAPEHTQEWVDKWGEIASPLLWSHAMYIILKLSC